MNATANASAFVRDVHERPVGDPPRSAGVAAVIHPRVFQELRRDARDLGKSGVHRNAVLAVGGLYAALMLVFWAAFATTETALTLGVITVLAAMYFGLLDGGILLSDSRPRGRPGRSFNEFLNGRTLTLTGWISGREALTQMIFLPACLAVDAAVIGLIWRFTAG